MGVLYLTVLQGLPSQRLVITKKSSSGTFLPTHSLTPVPERGDGTLLHLTLEGSRSPDVLPSQLAPVGMEIEGSVSIWWHLSTKP